jgi:hypothetical protein
MRGEPGTNDDDNSVLDIFHVIKQIFCIESEVEGGTTIAQLCGETDRLRPSLAVVRRIESLGAIFCLILHVRRNVVVRVRVRSGNKDRTCWAKRIHEAVCSTLRTNNLPSGSRVAEE